MVYLCLSVAMLAATATSRPASQESPSAITAKLLSADVAERRAAEKALKDFGPAAVPTLIELAKSGDAGSQIEAAYVLGTIGVKAAGASPVLCGLVAGGGHGVQIHAAVALGRIGPTAAGGAAALVAALGSEELGVRRAAGMALAQMGKPALAEVVKALGSGNALVRQCAAQAVREMGSDGGDAVDALCELLRTEKDWSVRREAMLALGKIGPAAAKAAPLLAEAFGREPGLRRLASSTLGVIDADANQTLGGVLKALESPDPLARRDALEVVGRVGQGSASARKAVARMVREDSSGLNRTKAAFVLVEMDPNAVEVVPVLLDTVGRDCGDREKAIWAVQRFAARDARVVPAIAAVMDDKEGEDMRAAAAWALGEIGKPAHALVPRIIKQLSDEAEAPRAAAAACLGRFGPDAKAATAELAKGLDDKSPWVRSQAAGALHRIGVRDERIVPAIAGGLKADRPWVRADAAELLIQLGPAAKAATGELEKLLADPDNYPRMMAAAALHAVDPTETKGVEALLGILKERRMYPWFKKRTCELLGEIKASSPGVQAALNEVIKTGNPEQRKAAEDAMRKIKAQGE